MTTHQKMSRYNSVQIHIHIHQHKLRERIQVKVRRRQRREQQLLIEPQSPKVELVYLKKEGITYIQHLECNVEDGTERLVYFDARYTDPNLRFDTGTKTWIPGLFRNVTQLHLNEDTMIWLPAQPHADIVIIC